MMVLPPMMIAPSQIDALRCGPTPEIGVRVRVRVV